MTDSTFIKRVRLKNYRSIESCDVTLGPLNFLVGPNGSGKSNFLDAIRFVADGLKTTFADAVSARGGLWALQWHAGNVTPAPDISIDLDFRLPGGGEGNYALNFGLGGVHSEVLRFARSGDVETFYEVQDGSVVASSINPAPAAGSDSLYLVHASGLPQFRAIYEVFTHLEIYNINHERIRQPQQQGQMMILARDGSNLGDMLSYIDGRESSGDGTKRRIVEYLAAIIPGITNVIVNDLGSTRALVFANCAGGNQGEYVLQANSMSDGTLRALGNLVALFQTDRRKGRRPCLIGIEEPETALHPAALGVLIDALRGASETSQVIVTSHSPDLLDRDDIPQEQVLAVESQNGATKINRIDEASRSALEDRLSTPGELLRLNQLQPQASEAKSG